MLCRSEEAAAEEFEAAAGEAGGLCSCHLSGGVPIFDDHDLGRGLDYHGLVVVGSSSSDDHGLVDVGSVVSHSVVHFQQYD